ncbi:helix-turn-helix domain-containing protein [Burkholderia territorii]|uniref:helix-turn-helix domain-containing protein n=1 Tax=Burkholderia territorii TaxID=1503055 RepID=UPI0012D9B553
MEIDLQSLVRTLVEAGCSQRQIARRVGCSQPTISNILSGNIGKVRPSYTVVTGIKDMVAEVQARKDSVGA